MDGDKVARETKGLERSRGKGGVDRLEVDRLQGCRRGRLGKNRCDIWENRCERGLNHHNL